MIKQAQTDTIKSVLTAATYDRILADLDAGITVSPAQLRKVISEARGGIDIPTSYLSDSERAEVITNAVQGAADQLQYARSALTQDFFANSFLPHEMRRQVAAYLWGQFGERGNPIWKNYLDGTFQYINPVDTEDTDA